MYKDRRVTAIVIAGGSGSRMNREINKLFLKIGENTVIALTLNAVCSSDFIDDIVLVYRHEDLNMILEELPKVKKNGIDIKLVKGGSSRGESAFYGLLAVPEATQIVLVHDGARPFIKKRTIDTAISMMEHEKAVIVGVPCKDTIKLVRDDLSVQTTPNRKLLYMIQTPQVFEKDLLIRASHISMEEGFNVTDDASMVEKLGVKVKLTMGEYTNIKITTAEDLIFGEAIINGEI